MEKEAVVQAAVVANPQVTDFGQINVQEDMNLQARVSNYLAERCHWALRHLNVSAFNGTVTIKGIVENVYEKQLAAKSCQRVAGVLRIIDEIEIS